MAGALVYAGTPSPNSNACHQADADACAEIRPRHLHSAADRTASHRRPVVAGAHRRRRGAAAADAAAGDGRRGGLDHWQNMQESETVVRMLAEDGLPEWRPDASLLPPQKPPDATMGELLAAVPAGGTALLAFGNAGGASMLKNWAYHILKLGLGRAMVIAAFDDVLFRELRALQLPAYNYAARCHRSIFAARRSSSTGWASSRRRRSGRCSRRGTSSSPMPTWCGCATRRKLDEPAAGATLAASTDCLHAAADEDKTPRRHCHLCGHSPGNVFGAVFNTGLLSGGARGDRLHATRATQRSRCPRICGGPTTKASSTGC